MTLDGETATRHFDLNIETVLDDWEVCHAIREVIANAIDEQALTGTQDIKITGGDMHFEIRDYGRGIRHTHLTQNENEEKIGRPDKAIGKFGVGLKDALATFDRHRIAVAIKSRHCDITVSKSPKHGFDDILTLHAIVAPPSDPSLNGTLVVLDGCTEGDMGRAMQMFTRFNDETVSGQHAVRRYNRAPSGWPGAHIHERDRGSRGGQLYVLVQRHVADRSDAQGAQPRAH